MQVSKIYTSPLNMGFSSINRFLFILLTHSVIDSGNGFDVIQCNYHAWWAIIQLDNAVVDQMLSGTDAMRMDVNVAGLDVGKHPVTFEMGKERKCGPIIPRILRQTFMEFKFEIPFLTTPGGFEPLVYKQKIIVNNPLHVVFSNALYKLNTSNADITMTDDSYAISLHDLSLHATILETGEWGERDSYPQLAPYETIMSTTWFGSTDAKTCADHHYKFPDIKIRPVTLTLQLDWNIVNSRTETESFSTPPITDDLAAIEVIVDFTMTLPRSCRKKT